jgi:hypothetical protein
MTQGQGTFTSATTTGTETMTQVQAQSDVIRTAQALSGNTTTNVPANMPGLRYVAVNNSTNAHTWSVGVTGGTAVTINQGYSCIVESDGTNMVQVSPQQTASAIQADTTQSSFTVGTNKAGASLTLQSDAATTNQTLTATADAFGGSGATAPLAVDWSTSTTPFIKSGTSAATLTVGTNKTSASFTLQAGAAANALALTNPSGGALVAAQTFGQHFAHQVSKGANYTIDSSGAGDEQIWMTAACTITLPNPASATGRIIEILVGYDPAVGGGTIARNGAENINGAAANLTLVTGHKWSVLSVRCNGTDWIVGKAVAF